jgi:uncharacterized protein (TIGR00255 family)
MTGFGKATFDINNRIINVEVRSVNSKSFDLNMRISSRYRDNEALFRSEISKECERGKIDVAIYADGESSKTYSINKELIKTYSDELKSINNEFQLNATDYLSMIMRIPEIITTESKQEIEGEEAKAVEETLKNALKAFNKFRTTEGGALQKELSDRIFNIEALLKDIEVHEPVRIKSIREKLEKTLSELINPADVDKNRLEQELIFYIEKLDITEEKVRLRSHCKFFIDTMSESTANGRKLGFIGQEIGREINTIGSKANDANIQKLVVQMKDELEKIKEQVLNVL